MGQVSEPISVCDQQLAARLGKAEKGPFKFSFPGEAVPGDSLICWFWNAFVENKL